MFGLSTLQAMGVSAFLALAIAAYPAIRWHNDRVDALEKEWKETAEAAAEAATKVANKACDENNQITKEQSHALQARLDDTYARYYSVLRQATASDNGAVTIADAARGNNDTASGAVPVMQIPIAAAKEADDQASRLIVLQNTVAEIYRKNGQADLLPDEYRKTSKPIQD